MIWKMVRGKPAVKVVLGICALSALTGGPIGAISSAIGQSFIQNNGLDSLLGGPSLELSSFLKDLGKNLVVKAGGMALGEVIGTTPAINIAKNTALHCAVYQSDPVKTLASQCLAEASLQGA
ncbi:hypothetical protein, partial [Holospora elegans]|uniref:hypothetical protein n=1 Tax=Holospora elegans TaxID=431043 RepID=UPI0005539302